MKTEKMGVIYRIYHKKSMRSYVGKTVRFDTRIRQHFNGHSTCTAIARSINKYGKDAFVIEVLESDVHEELLSKMEILNIRFWNSKAPNGYNLTDGGEGASNPSEEARRKMGNKGKNNPFYGKTLSDEHKRKIAKANMGHKYNLGTTRSSETRKKISDSLKGKTKSPETRQRLSEACTGRVSGMKGKRHTAEARKRMSEAHQGKKLSDEQKLKLSESRKGDKHPLYGKPRTQEVRDKISETKRKRGQAKHHKSSPYQLKLFD